MNNLPTLSRRDTFLFAASAAAAATPAMPTLAAALPAELNWEDPAERVRIQSAIG